MLRYSIQTSVSLRTVGAGFAKFSRERPTLESHLQVLCSEIKKTSASCEAEVLLNGVKLPEATAPKPRLRCNV